MDKSEKAVSMFIGGCNCAQSVLGAMAEDAGLEVGLALKLSASFGGGMRAGELCGAVTGGQMFIGLKYGYDAPMTQGQKSEFHSRAAEFNESFRRAHGSLVCRELLGCDTSTPEGAAKFKGDCLSEKVCRNLIKSAVDMLEKQGEGR